MSYPILAGMNSPATHIKSATGGLPTQAHPDPSTAFRKTANSAQEVFNRVYDFLTYRGFASATATCYCFSLTSDLRPLVSGL